MGERESRPTVSGAAINATREVVNNSKASAADIAVDATRGPLIHCESPEQYDLVLESWARGWEAAAAFYKPMLDRANADADRLYVKAFPAETRRRVNAGLAQHADAFLRGEYR